jgi:uncharacterized protein YozE (UPF0346 family)
MKHTIIILATVFLMSCSKSTTSPYFIDHTPPIVSTTESAALSDYALNKQNEAWYSNTINGNKFVSSTYLINAAGLSHMMARYDSLVKAYDVQVISDKSRLEFTDFAKLATSINTGKSWILKYGELNGKYIKNISMYDNKIAIQVQ